MTERSFDALNDAVEAVQGSADLQQALDRIVVALPRGYELWSANISRFVSADALRVLVSWSTGETLFTAGTDVSVHYTEESAATAATLQRGYPVVARSEDVDFGIVSSIMAREGVASLALIPIHDGVTVSAILALASAAPEGITTADVPFLTGLGRGIEERIMELIRRADRDQHPAARAPEDSR